MKIKILKSAQSDLNEGYHFYERQQNGVGKYFRQALTTDIESLELLAGIHPTFFNKYLRMLSKRFPFAIYYRIEGQEIKIFAIIDCRKDPALIKNKLH